MYQTSDDNQTDISSESPVILRFQEEVFPTNEYSELAKIMEMLASQKEGIKLLNENLIFVMEKLLVLLGN